ncbi:methionyl-tRNA formyltransferase [Pontiella sulfatireligans]|uniref:Methionyl-tRNA formyltransferase n=1 Tax=Pontiella sulfatireligans TaxID=2750658 RepID=A0A6C2UI84_9BACT|nr:methionyl-tRNA formyltransferase [Pontiella sulfatireligans]VGO19669.1 Methionyl-tRNA formyltransferase [Pontiella sulfatireligans]
MRIVFMGSAELSVPSLEAILQAGLDEVVGVVSQPDRPAGRKRVLTPCPLKAFAEQRGLNIITPGKIGDPAAVEALAAWKPDLFVVVAYGQYIPSRVIDLAPREAINVHPSLLPKYRGSAPIQWAIANGDETTGVSIIYLAPKMDAGDILRQETYPVGDAETSKTLHDKLAVFGASLLLKAIADIRNETVSRTVQDESQVVEVRKLAKEDAAIDWALPAVAIRNRIRAFDPWPGSTCVLPGGEVLKVWKAELDETSGKPGEVLDDRLLVAAGEGALRLVEIQPAGKKRMPADAFLNGRPVAPGEMLG